MAANLTTGNLQSYDNGEGLRLIQGVSPDIVLIQEFRYGDNEEATMQAMVDSTLGVGFSWCREYSTPPPAGTIPNGIISRWPIIECSSWDDPRLRQPRVRYARIDLPGPRDLWAVSLHLLTKDAPTRNAEAVALVSYLQFWVPEDDLLVIGGDFNAETFSEACFTTLSAVVDVAAPYPVDQNGNPYTNLKRQKPYDHVFADPDLRALQVPTYIGTASSGGPRPRQPRLHAVERDRARGVRRQRRAFHAAHGRREGLPRVVLTRGARELGRALRARRPNALTAAPGSSTPRSANIPSVRSPCFPRAAASTSPPGTSGSRSGSLRGS
jgi:endonuclease/exonuclease/phosphatase family metal-dependent hydrolase